MKPGKWPVARSRRWQNNIKVNHEEIDSVSVGLNWIRIVIVFVVLNVLVLLPEI
jgi:hypothetical protein